MKQITTEKELSSTLESLRATVATAYDRIASLNETIKKENQKIANALKAMDDWNSRYAENFTDFRVGQVISVHTVFDAKRDGYPASRSETYENFKISRMKTAMDGNNRKLYIWGDEYIGGTLTKNIYFFSGDTTGFSKEKNGCMTTTITLTVVKNPATKTAVKKSAKKIGESK